jgi:DNA repair protein RecN (Recombination protein N)
MLRSLYIKNYALIEELTAEFPAGLVILTGETGAGKSIIIGAMSLVIGERASSEVVRAGAGKAIVEGVFQIGGNKRLRSLLQEHDLEPAEEMIVRREVSAKGQSRCFVNDSPVTLGLQKQIGELLVDLHGQHEHQSLLHPENHLLMLDDFGGLDGMAAEFQVALARYKDAASRLEDLRTRERQLRDRRELYAYQLQEIDGVTPRAGEEEELESELRILENSEKLFGATGKLYEQLYEGEQSVHDLLVVVRNQLQDLAEIDRQFGAAAAECSSAEAIVKELAKFIQSYNARVEFNPERLEELRERLGRLSLLKKKYGGSLDAVLAHRVAIAREVELAENFAEVQSGLEQELEQAGRECGVLAQRLSAKRHETARKIDKAIVAELSNVGIPHARFTTRISQHESSVPFPAVRAGRKLIALNARGYDAVEFFLSTNLGEEERPLARVASGGEVSRIMLALKGILAKSDRLPILVFDEIDVGVSGRVAQAVGRCLKRLSGFHQVVAITHLPQIAGLADAHFVVYKTDKNKRSTTSMKRLTLDEQVKEVAKLMSGTRVTEAGLAGARELMNLG